MTWVANDPYLEEVLKKAFSQLIPEERDPTDLHPSSASAKDSFGKHIGACKRAMFYEKTLSDDEFTQEGPDLLGSFYMATGTLLGNFLSKCFQKANKALLPNAMEGELRIRLPRVTPMGNKYAVVGRTDQICLDGRGATIGYEFKTVYSDYRGGMVLGDWKGNFEADPKNVLQVALYAWWGRTSGILDWRLTYMYVNNSRKNKDFIRTYHISVDADGRIYIDGAPQLYTVPSIFKEYDTLADCLATKTLPDKDGKLFLDTDTINVKSMNNMLSKKDAKVLESFNKLPDRSSPCTYCQFKSLCWDKEEVLEHEAIMESK